MITRFGKILRKIRIDRDQSMDDMAKELYISTGFLSNVERGKRNVPETWIELLKDKYSLSENEISNIKKAISEDVGYVKIDITNLEDEKKNLAILISQKIRNMDISLVRSIILDIMPKNTYRT